jgi:hypothetical protein
MIDTANIKVGDRVRVNLSSDAVKRAFPSYHRGTVAKFDGKTGAVRAIRFIDDKPDRPGAWAIDFDVPRLCASDHWFIAIELESVT